MTYRIRVDERRARLAVRHHIAPTERVESMVHSTPKLKPWVALLPALDPTTMGWQAREWYLGAHKNALFDRNGNAGPTIWVNGRIIGGWAIRKSGEVVSRLLEDVGRAASLAVEAEAARLTASLGKAPPVARFPTPLAKELIR